MRVEKTPWRILHTVRDGGHAEKNDAVSDTTRSNEGRDWPLVSREGFFHSAAGKGGGSGDGLVDAVHR